MTTRMERDIHRTTERRICRSLLAPPNDGDTVIGCWGCGDRGRKIPVDALAAAGFDELEARSALIGTPCTTKTCSVGTVERHALADVVARMAAAQGAA